MAPKSETEVKAALKRLLEEIDVLKEQARKRGCAFAALSEEQLTRKLRGETSHSPFFTAAAWDQFTNSGSPSFFLANYFNPDPQTYLAVELLPLQTRPHAHAQFASEG